MVEAATRLVVLLAAIGVFVSIARRRSGGAGGVGSAAAEVEITELFGGNGLTRRHGVTETHGGPFDLVGVQSTPTAAMYDSANTSR